MSDAKHTPGPWKVVRNSRNCTLNVVSAPDADGESVKIALVNYQDEANANLIAAAPDMRDEITCLRAALEGVTEPASPWRDIESAPKDGTSIEVWDESPGAVNPAVVYWEEGVWVYADNLLADAAPDGALPSHWRQRSEPPR